MQFQCSGRFFQPIKYISGQFYNVTYLYFRLSGVYRQLESCTDAAEHDALEADKAVILAEIGTYVGYLNGYED